jgi:hypothetical protein
LRAALLQIGANARDRPWPGIAAVAEIENEAGVSYGIPAETGWRSVILAQKLFYFSEQIHHLVLIA